MTILATPRPSDPANPDRPWPWPVPPVPSFAMARPDDMPVPATPAPPPPPRPTPGVWRSFAVVAVAAPAFVLVPYLLDVRVIAALFLAAAVVAYPKSRTLPSQVNTARTAPRIRVPWQSRATHSRQRYAMWRAGQLSPSPRTG